MKYKNNDKYNLNRFVEAQNKHIDNAIKELKSGKRLTRWMWCIFPRVVGIGRDYKLATYSIKSIPEAKEYLNNTILNKRMHEICSILLSLQDNNPINIFGIKGSQELKSSMTLFNVIYPNEMIFKEVLKKYFGGERDIRTISKINKLYKDWIRKLFNE